MTSRYLLAVYLLLFSNLFSEQLPFRFEGILGSQVNVINNMNSYAVAFLPYNPIIVEIGANTGQGTVGLAKQFKYGRIYAFEPRPEAFILLQKNLSTFPNTTPINLAISDLNGMVSLNIPSHDRTQASVLMNDNEDEETISIHSFVLDEWCQLNGIPKVDFIRLDVNGMEFKILQSSPTIVSNAIVIITKTYFHKPRNAVVHYKYLKKFLEYQGFELLSHWYQEGAEGEATFVRKEIYDALFR